MTKANPQEKRHAIVRKICELDKVNNVSDINVAKIKKEIASIRESDVYGFHYTHALLMQVNGDSDCMDRYGVAFKLGTDQAAEENYSAALMTFEADMKICMQYSADVFDKYKEINFLRQCISRSFSFCQPAYIRKFCEAAIKMKVNVDEEYGPWEEQYERFKEMEISDQVASEIEVMINKFRAMSIDKFGSCGQLLKTRIEDGSWFTRVFVDTDNVHEVVDLNFEFADWVAEDSSVSDEAMNLYNICAMAV